MTNENPYKQKKKKSRMNQVFFFFSFLFLDLFYSVVGRERENPQETLLWAQSPAQSSIPGPYDLSWNEVPAA